MCKKVNWSFIKFVTSFLQRDSISDKTCHFVHGNAFEVQHEMPISGEELLKTPKNLLQMFNFHQIFSVCLKSCVFGDSVNFYKLLN